MKNLFVLYILFSVSLFGQFSNPKIVPHEKEFNFGKIAEGELVSHNFILYNRGGETLKITKVKASCGCTAANPLKTELLPGDSTSVKVEFNSTRRRGPQRKYVYIFSNDPETPQLRLVFTANIVSKEVKQSSNDPVLKLSKYNHNFGNVEQGKIVDVTIDVINAGNSNLNIKNIKSSCGCTAALLSSKNIKPSEKGELKIEFDTKNLSGNIARTVTLFSNDPVNPTRVLTLIATIEEG